MNEKLIEETKKAMRYMAECKSCENCLYSKNIPDDMGCLDLTCIYSNLCPFKVEKYGLCDKYSPM